MNFIYIYWNFSAKKYYRNSCKKYYNFLIASAKSLNMFHLRVKPVRDFTASEHQAVPLWTGLHALQNLHTTIDK